MKHRPLADLRVRHAYYADGRCADLTITPSAAGARTAARLRWIVKNESDGVRVLAPVDEGGGPFIALDGARVELELRVANPELALFTELAEIRGMTAPVFVNPGGQAGGALVLQEQPGRRLSPGVLAEVAIGGVDAAWLVDGPARFTLELATRSARWVYYVVTDLHDGDIELVDGDGLVFAPGTGVDLHAAPDPGDRQAAELAARYPGARLLRFTSVGPVACSDAPRRRLELRHAGERLPLRVPGPSLTNYASHEFIVDSVPQRQESLFRVVKHLTQAFLVNG